MAKPSCLPSTAIQIETSRLAINRESYQHGWGIFCTDYGDSDYQLQAHAETGMSDDAVFKMVYDGFVAGDDICEQAMRFLRNHAPCEADRIENYARRRCIVRNIKMRED